MYLYLYILKINCIINNIMCKTSLLHTTLINPTIYITHLIDSLSIFTIPSLYEVMAYY